jgi:hypothetical protein
VLNATLSNISAISWRLVLVVEEPERTTGHVRATGKLYHLRLRVLEICFFSWYALQYFEATSLPGVEFFFYLYELIHYAKNYQQTANVSLQ